MKNSRWLMGATLLGAALVGACDGGTAKGGGAGAADVSRIARRTSAISLDIVELSAADARDRMAEGTLTARELTQAYLDRIARIDDAGPRLDAIVELNPRALLDAAALDAERRAGMRSGPLHGIPVLIKDNIDVAGMVNSAGSLALAAHRPKEDAFLVARLRAAGAVILGKTNLSEWANFRSTRATSGWSSRGGQTKNPYVLDRNPCGSSSGTGAAIAASLGAIGVGTETDGSILCPSSVNGLVGLKPTVGLISRSGIIPISISQDTAGPMARTVTDAAILLGALAAVDPADPAAWKQGALPRDYTIYLKPGALRGKRLGVLRQAMGTHPDVDRAAEASMATLRAQGAELVDVEMDTYNRWNEPEFTLMLYEFKDGLNMYLRRSGAPHASLEALIAWNKAHADTVMPFFGQELFEKAQALGPLTDAAYLDAREAARRLAGKEGLLAVLDGERLDAVVAPSMAPAWLTDHVLGDHFMGTSHGVAAVAGTPSITVPMGESHGLPLGFVFMGRAYAEGELLGMAFAFEQAARARRAPAFAPTLRR
ncbi:amidase [Polyangium sorediatum]|uniref:Amidase n=1 Tax=Polyangium sorediatum TaxID=889274 RepID=A0ABT6NLM8_9BACT|nr:amidase [Polyangium sorediatum]MDI1429125.1 amidase [Polyangium sorediatum]